MSFVVRLENGYEGFKSDIEGVNDIDYTRMHCWYISLIAYEDAKRAGLSNNAHWEAVRKALIAEGTEILPIIPTENTNHSSIEYSLGRLKEGYNENF